MRHLNTSRKAASLFRNSDILCLVMLQLLRQTHAIAPSYFYSILALSQVRTYTVQALSIVIYRYTYHHTRPSRKLEVSATLLFDTHNQSCRTPGVPPLDISTKYLPSARSTRSQRSPNISPLHDSRSQPRHSTKFFPNNDNATLWLHHHKDHGCTGSEAWARGDANCKTKPKVCTVHTPP
jgi:hypothetical protein